MARLPTQWTASNAELDANNWADILDEYLLTEHNADGTHGTISGDLVIGDDLRVNGSVGVGVAPPTNGLHVLSTGAGILGQINIAGGGIAVQGLSASTGSGAVVGVSTGYYAGHFFNVTDAGSDLANANMIGVVSQSVYANSSYIQQGAISGTGSTLARNSVYPAEYITRVAASLGGFDFTAPLLRIEDTTASTGDYFDVKNSSGTVIANLAKTGGLTIPTALTITGSTDTINFAASAANGNIAATSTRLIATSASNGSISMLLSGSGNQFDVRSTADAVQFSVSQAGNIVSAADSGIGMVIDRGIQLNASVSSTVAGPGFAVSSNVLRFTGGTSGFSWISQDNGTGLATMSNAGSLAIGVAASASALLLVGASTTSIASLRIPHGSAPTSPVDGDIWTTSTGLFVRINGATVGPLS